MFSLRNFQACFAFLELKEVSAWGQGNRGGSVVGDSAATASLRGLKSQGRSLSQGPRSLSSLNPSLSSLPDAPAELETTYQKVGDISKENQPLSELELDNFVIRKVGTVSERSPPDSADEKSFSLKQMTAPMDDELLASVGGNIVNVVKVLREDEANAEQAHSAQADDSAGGLFHTVGRQVVNFVEVVDATRDAQDTSVSVVPTETEAASIDQPDASFIGTEESIAALLAKLSEIAKLSPAM